MFDEPPPGQFPEGPPVEPKIRGKEGVRMSSKCHESLVIDGTEYVKKGEKITGNRHVCVLDRGWIFVGDLEVDADGTHRLTNVYNVRKWSQNGFGGLVKDPRAAGATLDASRDVSFKNPLFVVPVPDGWGGV